MIHTGGPQWGAEAFHGAFAVPGRLMGVLRPVVEVSGLPVLDRRHHRPMRHLIASELVGCEEHPACPTGSPDPSTCEPLQSNPLPDRQHVSGPQTRRQMTRQGPS